MIVHPKATAGFPQIYILDPDHNVIEINAGPGLRMHLSPSKGTPRPVGRAIITLKATYTEEVVERARRRPGNHNQRRSAVGRGDHRTLEHTIDVTLKEDTHVIVVALAEESEIGEVMGPLWGRQKPAAMSNPIFVDVDGNGFKANGDTLGLPLPVKGGKAVK